VAEAKRLGIPYEASSEPPLTTDDQNPDAPKGSALNTTHPMVRQAMQELAPNVDLVKSVRTAAKDYGLKAVYKGSRFVTQDPANSYELATIFKGKEVSPSQNTGGPGTDSLATFSGSSQTLDNSLIEPFLLKGLSLKTAAGEPVPILAPIDAAEKLVGLEPLSSKATPEEKLARLKDVRQKVRNLPFEVCYRNGAAVELRQLAKQQAVEAAAKKADYVAPSLQYVVGSAVCSPTTVSKDTRGAEEKALAAKTDEFKAKFGVAGPKTEVLKFRVVGLLPKLEYGSGAFNISDLIASLVSSTLGPGWYISDQAARTHPVLGNLLSEQTAGAVGFEGAVAEFNDRAGQKRFIEEKSCSFEGFDGRDGVDPTVKCAKENKFYLFPYGNPLAAIYDASDGFDEFKRWVLLVIGVLTAIIMMGTVGKVIADGRKETSVFRAVGAKRLDIDQIYLLYAAILAALAFAIAAVLGLIAALLFEGSFSAGMSVAAVLAFNSPDADKAFHFIGFNGLDLLSIFGFAVLAGVASAILPLATNTRRNPIKDMREE
jgi:hypothetical protein